MKIIGYPAELIYRPGDKARFMVSTDGIAAFDAALVRIICGDPRDTGPGFKEAAVAGCRKSAIPGKRQGTEIGSFMSVCPGPALANKSVGFVFNVFATTPTKGNQTLLARWDETRKLGFKVEIDERSRIEMEVGDGAGATARLTLPRALPAGHWTTVAAGFTGDGSQMSLMAKSVDPHGFGTEIAQVTGEGLRLEDKLASLPLTFAARSTGRKIAPKMTGFFNGRLESPVMLVRIPTGTDIDAYQSGAERVQQPAALWDFGRDFAASKISERVGGLDGELANLPSRGVTGSKWDGSSQKFLEKPEHYCAVHFHDDDLEDCAWDETFSFDLPRDLASGIYAAKLTADDAEHHVVFLVEERSGENRADIAFLASSLTYLAYSNEHYDFDDANMEMKGGAVATYDASDLYMNEHRELGLSTYDRHSDGYGVFYSSARRPLFSMHVKHKIWALNADTHITDWLEARRLPYDLITDHAVHAEGLSRLSRYKVVITGTHPEYWTTPMWEAMTRYLAAGGRLMYLGGNGFYWRTALHPQKPWLLELRRAETGARYWESEPGEAYMSFTGEYSGLWRRAATPPQKLVGLGTVATGFDYSSYYRRRPESNDPRARFIFEGVDEEILGDFGSIGGGAAGSEIDRADPWLGTPAHALILARSEEHTRQYNVAPEETTFHHPTINGQEAEKCYADLLFFETPKGGAVFSTGSISWAASLAHNGYANNISRMTENVVRRFADPAPFPEPPAGSGSAELRRTRIDQGHEAYQGIDRIG
jgi:N,N-dimethylformamidase beta subunit-like protein